MTEVVANPTIPAPLEFPADGDELAKKLIGDVFAQWDKAEERSRATTKSMLGMLTTGKYVLPPESETSDGKSG